MLATFRQNPREAFAYFLRAQGAGGEQRSLTHEGFCAGLQQLNWSRPKAQKVWKNLAKRGELSQEEFLRALELPLSSSLQHL